MSSSAVLIYAVIPVPSTSGNPSVHTLQWTADGQLLIVTKTDIYVLTPSLGLNFDVQYAVQNPPPGDIVQLEDAVALGLFQTMIPVDKGLLHQWPINCRDWAAVALGSLDLSIRSVTVSPSGLTPHGRCVVAVLNSNLELTIWHAVKNHLRGEWAKIEDITALLIRVLLGQEASSAFSILRAQVTAISWSHQAGFGLNPEPPFNGSLLAVATRSMEVHFLRYCLDVGDSAPVEVHASQQVDSSAWISHLAWTTWTNNVANTSRAYLAIAFSDGSLQILRVTQSLTENTSKVSTMTEHKPTILVEDQHIAIFNADERAITCLSWILLSSKKNILLFGKPGAVYLWCSPSIHLHWSGLRMLHLTAQTMNNDPSALHPISGICSSGVADAVVISLHDGSFRIIHNVTTSPSLNEGDGQTSTPSSRQLTAAVRAVFDRTERVGKESATKAPDINVNRISGMVEFGHGPTLAWLQENMRPSDFSYKPDAKRTSKLLIAEIFELSTTEFSSYLKELLHETATVRGRAPIDLLRPVFLQLQKPGMAEKCLPNLLSFLHCSLPDSWPPLQIPSYAGDVTPQMRIRFRNSLASHLHGSAELFSLRLRFSTATLALHRIPDGPMRVEMADIVFRMHATILSRILHTLIRHLIGLISVITPSDAPFAMRVIVQALLPGNSAQVIKEAQNLSNAVLSLGLGGDGPAVQGFEETCPACGTTIVLNSIADAHCERGHTWGRCSVTSFVLSTSAVRTCIGCARKAFLPEAWPTRRNHLPACSESWVVQELLSAVSTCLFCGNAFVTLV